MYIDKRQGWELVGDYKGLYDCKTLVERDLKMVGIEHRERRTVIRYRPVEIHIIVNRYRPVDTYNS